jgi:hypothetical protein
MTRNQNLRFLQTNSIDLAGLDLADLDLAGPPRPEAEERAYLKEKMKGIS